MPTNILDLPLLSFSMTVGTNEHWLDSWAYVNAGSAPISLAGIELDLMVRREAESASAQVIASTAPTVDGLAINGTVTAGGVGGNVVGLNIPPSTMERITPGEYVWELLAIGDGVRKRIGVGSLAVSKGVVR